MPSKRFLICEYCGKDFVRILKPSKKSPRFCTPACKNKSRGLALVKCPICGKEFKPKRINGANKPAKRYCSRKCACIASRGKISPKRTDRRILDVVKKLYPMGGAESLAKMFGKSVKAICQIAHKLGIRLTPETYRKKVHESARAYMKTKNNPGYISGNTCKEWGNNWPEQRKAALKRDKYTCQNCGNSGRSVHHIKARRFFIGHMEDANTLDNLITFCSGCHIKIERGKIKYIFT